MIGGARQGLSGKLVLDYFVQKRQRVMFPGKGIEDLELGIR
jgi:hypothetical protein